LYRPRLLYDLGQRAWEDLMAASNLPGLRVAPYRGLLAVLAALAAAAL
jgi:hypothetical protein